MLDYRLNPGPNEKVLQNKRSIRVSGLQLNKQHQYWTFFTRTGPTEKFL